MNRTWTAEEVAYLRLNAHKPDQILADELSKTKRAVENKRRRIGISKNRGLGERIVKMDIFNLSQCGLIIKA